MSEVDNYPMAPLKKLIAERDILLAACRKGNEAYKLLMAAPELNMSNYTEDQIAELNHAVNEACCKLESISIVMAAAEPAGEGG